MLKKGFTLVEMLIVMAVVAILVAIIIPSYRAMQNEAWIAKAEKELQTLQVAVESYYRHHNNNYPEALEDLLDATPAIVTRVLADPWKTGENVDGVVTYGYRAGNVSGFGDYYIIYSKGLDDIDQVPSPLNGEIVIPEGSDDIAVSNMKITRQQ